MKLNVKYILNPVFIVSLLLLLINDFYLKFEYHNWITGKLSDVAGLIVFVHFFTAFKSEFKKYIFITTVLLFSFWKSEYSQFLIDTWNALNILKLGRTIDYSDILCLLVLIPLYRYVPKDKIIQLYFKKVLTTSILIVTFFAIVATSRIRYMPSDAIYFSKYVKVNSSKEHFLEQLEKDQIEFTVTDSLMIFRRDTLNRIELENIIIGRDSISSATIGILDRGKHIKLYIANIAFQKDSPVYIDWKEYNKWSKKYKIETENFFKEFQE